MDLTITGISLLVGLIVGFVIGHFSATGKKGETERLRAENELLSARIKDKDENMRLSLQEREESARQIIREKDEAAKRILEEKQRSYQESYRRLEAYHAESMGAMQARFDETIKKLQSQLQATTSEMLRERQREFGESSSEQIKAIVAPLNDTIAEMKQTMASNTDQQSVFTGIFSASIDNLLKQNEAARQSADRLANALRGNTKIQGEWGETVLTELLESQGLKEGIHFDTQSVLDNSSGSESHTGFEGLSELNTSPERMSAGNLRPDVVLHLDNRRDVIIDSKASLSAYLNYMDADSPEEKNAALKAHIISLENHVKELVRKNYSALVKPPRASIGYVIMFVPNTTALLLATTAKPGLWRWAMEQNVYIADEQTLYAALKIVHLTWTQIAQTENHRKVYALADEMLDRIGKFMEKYTLLGKSIQTLSKTYEEGLKKIQEEGHSVPQTCRKLIRMGAKMERRKGVDDTLLGLSTDVSADME